LIDIARLLKAEIIVGIGKYAEKRAQIAVQTAGLPIQVTYIYIYYNFIFYIFNHNISTFRFYDGLGNGLTTS